MDEIFVNVNDLAFYSVDADGTDHINVAAANVGDGARALKIDQSGLWLGAEKWADAPFRVDMAGNATMSSISLSGYVEDTGGQYVSAASGARVLLYPSSSIGFQAVDASSNNVFLLYVGGSNVGDVVIGDYSGGTGILWDNSAGDLIIKGDMTAGNISGVDITGVTITGSSISTGTTGTRVEMSANGDTISIYDSGNDLGFEISLQGSGFARILTDDNRALRITADTNDDLGHLYVGGDGAYFEYYTQDDSGGNAWFDFYGYSSWFYVVDDFEVLDNSGGGTGGNLYVEGDFNFDGDLDMNSSTIKGLNRMDWYAVTSDLTDTGTKNASLYLYHDVGGDAYYWRSIFNQTGYPIYQFDQHSI